MQFFLIFLFFISINLSSSPWFDYDEVDVFILKNQIEKLCDIKGEIYSHSPIPLSEINKIIFKASNNKKIECVNAVKNAQKYLKKRYSSNDNRIGYQSKTDKLYFQERGSRYYLENNIYFSSESVSERLAYKIKLSKNKYGYYFDESYISYLINDKYQINLGKVNKWWSPSSHNSLILSNSARPIPSITFSTYNSINPIKPFFKIIGPYDFELFIGKLERKREIPNALIFGNRFTFRPTNDLTLSLYRVAQFGGKGRTINSSTIKNLIIGKDTTNRSLGYSEQPGNQIAGIDFVYRSLRKPNLKIFGQYFGEDGLDPIIDDRWVGAIFPSKRFGSGGIIYSFKNNNEISLEHVNTDSGFKNVTYNHSLYKSGYRYKGLPIGASIDADSHQTIFALRRIFDEKYIKFKISKFDLNQNSSDYSAWGNDNISGEELSIKLHQKITPKLSIDLTMSFRNTNSSRFDKNLFFIKVEQRL